MAEIDRQNSRLSEGEILRLNEWQEPAGWLLATCMALAGAYLLLVPASHPPKFDGPLRFVIGAGWLAFAAFMVRTVRSGILVHESGVQVRTLVHTTHWDWNEIADFGLRRSIIRPGLRMRMRSGAEFRGLGLVGRSAGEWRLAEQIVAELNDRLSSH